jgi:magnesium-protoporphyrin O-methyltransferase
MTTATTPPKATRYVERRAWLLEYFDRTAVKAWEQLTSDAPVGRVRQTVREGRDRMRGTLLSWLPTDLTGRSVLDAGCGTGAAAIELARRGAHVVAIDLSPTLVNLARERSMESELRGSIDFRSGDMLDPALGAFDHVLAMDSLIHYDVSDIAAALSALASRTRTSMVVTYAPSTPLLEILHNVGRLIPSGDRAPAIEPVRRGKLYQAILDSQDLTDWSPQRTVRVKSGFYTSQALELARAVTHIDDGESVALGVGA